MNVLNPDIIFEGTLSGAIRFLSFVHLIPYLPFGVPLIFVAGGKGYEK